MTAAAKTRWGWRPACPVSVGIWLAVVVLAFPLVPGAQAHSPYETPPVMKVTDLAPAGLIVGQGYRVGENVPTTGLLGAFALEADVGTLDAHGLHLLRIRIGELGAIRQLEETSKTAEFAKAAGRAAMRPVEATVNMVAHPVDTISGMPASVGRFFDRVKLGGESIAQAASAPDKGGMERTADVGERIGAVTINPILSKKLTDVAWVTFSAREAVNLTTAVVMPYSMVMSTVSLTNNLIWDMKPADLVAPNQKKATDMGAGDEAASALIANKNYSTSALTALRTALPHPGTGRRGGAGGHGSERGPGPLPHGFRPDAGAPSRVGDAAGDGDGTRHGGRQDRDGWPRGRRSGGLRGMDRERRQLREGSPTAVEN